MKQLSPELQAALESGQFVVRDFVWFVGRDRDTGNPVAAGFWSGVDDVAAEVYDPQSGQVVSRNWNGAGNLVAVSAVPMTVGLSVNAVTISMSHLSPEAEALFRGEDMRRARVELFRGHFDPVSHELIEPATARFVGFIDEAPIDTPAEGGDGSITVVAASYTQELMRSNPAKRSDANQRRRNANDTFFKDVATIGQVKIFWGQKAG